MSYRQSDAAWTAPTLTNSWANYGSGFVVAGYRKDASGYVHLRGLVKSGSVNTVIFTLPAGYRPSSLNIFACEGSNGSSTDSLKRVDVYQTGEVQLQNTASTEYLSLNTITFLAEA